MDSTGNPLDNTAYKLLIRQTSSRLHFITSEEALFSGDYILCSMVLRDGTERIFGPSGFNAGGQMSVTSYRCFMDWEREQTPMD